jgi:formylglycine-generating enzyme required for sulfatase activity
LSNQAISAYKESRLEFVRRYLRRHAVVVKSVSIAAIVALILGLGFWGFFAWNRACKIDQYSQEAKRHESAQRLHEAQLAWKGILALDPDHVEAKRRADDLKERIDTAARIEAQRAKMREESAKVQGGDLANGRLLASAKDLFSEAKKLMESGVSGCAQQASTQFSTILATIPKKADGLPVNRDFELLDTECQKCLKRAEHLDREEKTRLVASLKGAVSTHLSKGDLPSAWGAFGQLTRISAMTPEIETLRGSLEAAEKKADAVKRMTEATTHFDRGAALVKEGKFDEAALEFRDVQVLIPGHERALQAGQQQKDCIIAANKRKDELVLAEFRAKLERLNTAIVGALQERQATKAREHLVAFVEAIRANPSAAVGYDVEARRREVELLETELNTQKALGLVTLARQAITESADIIRRKAQGEEDLNGIMCRLSRGQFSADTAAKTGQLRSRISQEEVLRQTSSNRAMTALHEARRLAPEHAEVKAAFADWCAQRVQEAMLNNLDAVAQAAADEGNLYDTKKRYSLLFHGQGRLTNQSAFPLEIRRLEPDSRGSLVATGQVVQVAAGNQCLLACGRYQADGKTRVTFRLGRAQEIQLKLWAPAKIPSGLAYHPGGAIRDRDLQNGTLGSQRVEVKPFLMGVTEVTAGEWVEFLRDHRDAIKATWNEKHLLILVPRAGYYAETPLWQHDDWRFELKYVDGSTIDAQAPVEYISRSDVDAYVAWRSRRDGVSWRLPTEAEWQIAVENGDGRHFPWGDTFDAGACAPMSETRRENKSNGETNVRVGSRPADNSPHGFKDLSGSVGEFVSAVFQTEDPDYALVAGGISFMDRQPHRFSSWGRRSVERRIPCRGIGLRLALDAR